MTAWEKELWIAAIDVTRMYGKKNKQWLRTAMGAAYFKQERKKALRRLVKAVRK